MTAHSNSQPVQPPSGGSPTRIPGGVWGYLAVALAALALGAGATFLAMGPRQTDVAVQPIAAAGTHENHAAPDTLPPPEGAGARAVYIAPVRQQLIGVRVAEVTHRSLESTIRTVGILAYDETRVTEIHTKVAGWVERVYVDFVGKPVRRGQPLVELYSPDLVATQKEYLLALKAEVQLAASQFEETRRGAANLVVAARERLRLWDVSDEQIAELERTGEARRTVTLYSPFNGVVLERQTFAGQYLSPEMPAVKIADLSRVWAIGEIFEYELARVRLGQEATVEFPYEQGVRTLTGRITFVYPDVDMRTRRAKVRIELPNPGLAFRPGSYVTLVMTTPGASELALPAEALIDTGTSRYAILALENGYFEPREVTVGPAVGEFYPVVKGLVHGDRVVTSAQFLIDSETDLKSAMQSMMGHGHTMDEPAQPGGVPTGPVPQPAPAPPVDHSGHTP